MKLQDKSSQIDVDLILKHLGYTHFKGSPLDDDGSAQKHALWCLMLGGVAFHSVSMTLAELITVEKAQHNCFPPQKKSLG